MLCSVDGCDRASRCLKMCRMHYVRFRRHGDPLVSDLPPLNATDEERLRFKGWTVVQRRDGMTPCWEWAGGKTLGGYGQLSIGARKKLASRVAFRVWVGEIPPGHDVCHRCDNPPCMNPEHLFSGTHQENFADGSREGRLATGKRNGATKLTREQVEQIRSEYARGGISQATLASRYGVATPTVGHIVRYLTWA